MCHQKLKLLLLVGLTSLMSACANQSTTPDISGNSRYNNGGKVNQQAEAHINLGAAYYRERKFDIALQEFQIAAKYDPSNAQAFNGLGLVYESIGQTLKADAAFQRAIQLSPTDSGLQNNYGNFLCNTQQYKPAIEHFLRAVQNPLYKTPDLAYNNAGICALRDQDEVRAAQFFKNALQINPLMHAAAYSLAKLQLANNEAQKAKLTLSNAAVSAASPKVLWLAMQIARKLNNPSDEANYRIQLRTKFPNSREAKLL